MGEGLLLNQGRHLKLLRVRHKLITDRKGFELLWTLLFPSCFEPLLSWVNLFEGLSVKTLVYVDRLIATAAYSSKMLLGVSAVEHLGG